MTHIEGQTQFRRSPADMFDFLADPRHEPQYNDAERPGRLAWRIGSAGLRVHGRQTVTATGDGSSVHWEWDFHLRGVLRLLGPLVGPASRRLERRVWSDMQHHLDRLELSTGTSAPKG